MRTRVFRILAGLLAVLFVCVLFIGDQSQWSWRELAGFGIITVLFTFFAVLGPQAADWWIMLRLGAPATKSPPKLANDTEERSQEKQ
jgi:hypothetical protein